MLRERRMTQAHISRLTAIPRSSISRWLSPNSDDFMGLAEAAMVSTALGVSVQTILPTPDWVVASDDHAELLNQVAMLPHSHLASMLICYAEIVGDGE